jgi:hypothetical protein
LHSSFFFGDDVKKKKNSSEYRHGIAISPLKFITNNGIASS